MRHKISNEQADRLKKLAKLADDTIDFSDIPPMNAQDWAAKAERGKFYRPIKESTTLRIDADVKAWLKSKGKGYQSKINEILRLAMLEELKQSH